MTLVAFIVGDHGVVGLEERVLLALGRRGAGAQDAVGSDLRQLQFLPQLIPLQFSHDLPRTLKTYLVCLRA
jgi:hypothetical protein